MEPKYEAGNLLKQMLNKRSFLQSSFAKRVGIDEAVISSILRGKTHLSPRYMQRIRDNNESLLTSTELESLAQQAQQDFLLQEAGYFVAPSKYIEVYEHIVSWIKITRASSGNIESSIAEISGYIADLEQLRNQFPSEKSRINRTIALMLVHELDAYSEIWTPKQLMQYSPIRLRDLLNVQNELKDNRDDYELALALPYGVNYLAGYYEQSLNGLATLYKQVTSSRVKGYCLRIRLAARAFLIREKRIEPTIEIKTEIQNALDDGLNTAASGVLNAADKTFVYDGSARVTRNPQFLELAHESDQQAVVQGIGRSYDRAGIARTELELACAAGSESDVIIQGAEATLPLLEHYQRRKIQVIEMLLSHPDKKVQDFGMSCA